jgi:uncharacterized protein
MVAVAALLVETNAEKIVEICRRHGVKKLAVFGSALREDFRADSDVDLLVEFLPDNRMGLFEFIEMQMELEDLLQRKVDLVSVGALKDRMRPGIVNSSQVLYAA